MDEVQNTKKHDQESIPADGQATVTVNPDGLSAEIVLVPPEPGGRLVTEDVIRAALAVKKVVAGIDEQAVQRLASSPLYHQLIPIAKGLAPVHGVNAVINQLIRTENDTRPKELPDGSVDYKDLGIIHSVHQGDVLCEKIPATQGTPGFNVYGAALAAKPGKDAPLPGGKNTVISDDKLKLIAACDGHADVVNRKIQVLNSFTVPGNVCNATGNISFLGHVVVEGNVLTGFMIQATGNVNVNGTVEGAQIVAGGNITLKEGINGSGKGLVQAGGYIKTKYIQSGTVQAGGDIETSFILHSTVQSGGSVRVVGSKGTIVGGRVVAMKSIEAMLIGGRSSYVPTTLEVGNDPVIMARSREIPRELDSNKRDAAALLRAINLLAEYKKAGKITPDKLESLQRAISTYQALSQTALELEEELRVIQETLAASGSGSVNIAGTAYPGVRIVIGSESMILENKYDHCSFIRSENGLHMVPLR